MKCQTCSRPLRPGQLVVPVHKVWNSSRYDPAPASEPVAYIHLIHLNQED